MHAEVAHIERERVEAWNLETRSYKKEKKKKEGAANGKLYYVNNSHISHASLNANKISSIFIKSYI